eukprot:ctg_1587.g606
MWKERIHNCLFAVADSGIVGFIGFIERPRQKQKHIADIFFFIRIEYRGKDIGDMPLKEATSAISSIGGVRKIELAATEGQESALAAYEKNRFSKSDILRDSLCLATFTTKY